MKSPRHRCGEICCRFWRRVAADVKSRKSEVGLLISGLCLLLAVTGCVTETSNVQRPTSNAELSPLASRPLPPVPVAKSAMAVMIEGAVQQAMATEQVRSNAAAFLAWSPLFTNSSRAVNIHSTNGTLLMTVSNASNCTIRGMVRGLPYSFYAVLFGETNIGNVTVVTEDDWNRRWIVPAKDVHAWRFTWKCAPGITNILLSSTNLVNWTPLTRFRGTNGVANILRTNSTPKVREYFQVFYQGDTSRAPTFGGTRLTNQSSSTLTQSTAFIRLTWNNSPTNALYKMVDARTESFVPIWTNPNIGMVSLVLPASGDQYRVMGRW